MSYPLLEAGNSLPRAYAHYHPQSRGVGNHIYGGIRFFGKILGVVLIIALVKSPENLQEGVFTFLRASASSISSVSIYDAGENSGLRSSPYGRGGTHHEAQGAGPLFLMDKASLFVENEAAFESKVRDIAGMLGVAPEWLMAVMYSESKFDASVQNYQGSGATGLIQFMEGTANELNISLERLRRMNHLQQLEYVYKYLNTVRERYGDYEGLTDLYLAVLYPKARKQEFCYTLYARPSQQYNQNSGLDENKDGRVTISDIDRRMLRLYPSAYIAEPVYN